MKLLNKESQLQFWYKKKSNKRLHFFLIDSLIDRFWISSAENLLTSFIKCALGTIAIESSPKFNMLNDRWIKKRICAKLNGTNAAWIRCPRMWQFFFFKKIVHNASILTNNIFQWHFNWHDLFLLKYIPDIKRSIRSRLKWDEKHAQSHAHASLGCTSCWWRFDFFFQICWNGFWFNDHSDAVLFCRKQEEYQQLWR